MLLELLLKISRFWVRNANLCNYVVIINVVYILRMQKQDNVIPLSEEILKETYCLFTYFRSPLQI